MSNNFPIYFYISASIMAVMAMIIDSEFMMLLFKPMIIPTLLIYYYSSDKKYLSPVLLIILFLYFISDALSLIKIKNINDYILIIDFLPYVMLVKVVLEDSFKVGLKKNELAISFFCFMALMLTLFFLINSLAIEFKDYSLPIIIYGSILAVFVSSSLYVFLSLGYDFTMYILIASLFALIADVIFIIVNMVFYVRPLMYIEFVFQIISYFYIVAYFVKRDFDIKETDEIFVK